MGWIYVYMFRKSSYLLVHGRRGLYVQRSTEITSVAGRKPKMESSTGFAKSIATLGASLQSLSTGHKLRSEMIESTVSFALAIAITCAASNRVGRNAVEERGLVTRASSSLPVAIGVTSP